MKLISPKQFEIRRYYLGSYLKTFTTVAFAPLPTMRDSTLIVVKKEKPDDTSLCLDITAHEHTHNQPTC